jgi:hypothetical protein
MSDTTVSWLFRPSGCQRGRDWPLPFDIEPITSRMENTMQVQINTDHNIEGHEALADQVRGVVESALSRLSDHITRVEVHLSDENSAKKGGNDDMPCMMEPASKAASPSQSLIGLRPWTKPSTALQIS